MKPLYYLFLLIALIFLGYLFINDFNFDNISFSNYLINILFIMLLSFMFVGIAAYIIISKRKKQNKGVQTIRQYYQYKSAR
ncbi:hypothetical protein D3C87_524240 [compost metagenome]